MAITCINLEKAVSVYHELCNVYMTDMDVDNVAPSLVAKGFDNIIDNELDNWIHVSNENLDETLASIQDDSNDVPHVLNELLYEIHQSFGSLGLIIRVVLLDNVGNLLIQTEDIDDDSYRFNSNTKDGIFQYPRYGNTRN